MRQRCWEHDYCAPSFYMLTIVTEPRRACLSKVGEWSRAATEQGELLTLSAMGEVVQEVWGRTSTVCPGVQACECVVMPDHFHGVLWVKERQKRHVGHIVKAFKRVSEQECRSKGLLLPPNRSKGLLLPPNRSKGLLLGMQEQGAAAATEPAAPAARGPASGSTLWQAGYQDTILLRKGQLAAMSRYIADNPRRLAMKRANPELFTVVATQQVGQGRSCPAIGNRFLLDRPVKRQVQVSRSISQEALADKKAELLYAAEHGAVLVSPCISPGEKEVARAAQDAGLPLIVLLENGFAPLYKPPGKYFDACAAGHLLILAPFPYHREKRAITRKQCLALNEWAELIADP
jgi:REP element-mobilizing transposase RayT